MFPLLLIGTAGLLFFFATNKRPGQPPGAPSPYPPFPGGPPPGRPGPFPPGTPLPPSAGIPTNVVSVVPGQNYQFLALVNLGAGQENAPDAMKQTLLKAFLTRMKFNVESAFQSNDPIPPGVSLPGGYLWKIEALYVGPTAIQIPSTPQIRWVTQAGIGLPKTH